MKVIRTAEEVIQAKENKRIANIGCDKCPYCKEKTNKIQHYKESSHSWENGKVIVESCDWYKCVNCGAVWKSDKYKGVSAHVFERKEYE